MLEIKISIDKEVGMVSIKGDNNKLLRSMELLANALIQSGYDQDNIAMAVAKGIAKGEKAYE